MYPQSYAYDPWNSPMQCPWHNPWNNQWPTQWRYDWNPYYANWNHPNFGSYDDRRSDIQDYGKKPFVINIAEAARHNDNYRTTIWTGEHFQVTLMSIPVGDDIGLEVHPTTDQFIRIEEGQGLVEMGDHKDKLDFRQMAYEKYAVMIPAGKWHNVTNTGNRPLKVYVIYAPPEHPFGTVHETKASAQEMSQ